MILGSQDILYGEHPDNVDNDDEFSNNTDIIYTGKSCLRLTDVGCLNHQFHRVILQIFDNDASVKLSIRVINKVRNHPAIRTLLLEAGEKNQKLSKLDWFSDNYKLFMGQCRDSDILFHLFINRDLLETYVSDSCYM